MATNLEFLLGLLQRACPAYAAWEDFTGSHGKALRLFQGMGFVSREPGVHPVPGCPHCGEGVPYRLGERYLCNRCRSTVDRQHLLLWSLDREAFLTWLAGRLHLQGGVRQIDAQLWQLGSAALSGMQYEWFFHGAGALSDAGMQKLSAYRQTLVLYGLLRPADGDPCGQCVSLLEILHLQRTLTVAEISPLLRTGGVVHFDSGSGALWVGDHRLGEVPVGAKEHAFLACLAEHRDSFVPYADIKHGVLQRTGRRDSTEEATFCQILKSRIKKKWIPQLDQLIATTNKGDGYRLRATVELS